MSIHRKYFRDFHNGQIFLSKIVFLETLYVQNYIIQTQECINNNRYLFQILFKVQMYFGDKVKLSSHLRFLCYLCMYMMSLYTQEYWKIRELGLSERGEDWIKYREICQSNPKLFPVFLCKLNQSPGTF